MGITTVSSKGQITIPKEIREKLNLGSGAKVLVELGSDGALIKPVPRPSETIRGIGKRAKKKLGNATAAELVDRMRKEDGEEL